MTMTMTDTAGTIRGSRRAVRAMLALCAVALLSACSGKWAVSYDAPIDRAVSTSWRVTNVDVQVPNTLKVSEQNSLAPNADIVWHGDLPGDRRAQVDAIVTEGARRAVAPLRGGKPVTLRIVMSQFHGVTPAAVAQAPAAVHNIRFVAQVFEAGSGVAVTPATEFRADLPAYVGSQAYAAASEGISEKKRIIAHLDAVLKGWLGIGPDIRGTFNSVGR